MVNLRLAAAADIPAMMDLERQCATAAHWSEGQYRAALPACGTGLTARLVLVADGDEPSFAEPDARRKPTIAGFLVARHLGSEWELENIVVDPASRRKGLGTGLLGEFLRRAESAGSEFVHLEVRKSNRPARAFYEKCKFKEIGRRKSYYSNPAEDAILYRRTLSVK